MHCCGVQACGQVQFGRDLSWVILSTDFSDGMENACSQGTGAKWTRVNSISAKNDSRFQNNLSRPYCEMARQTVARC